MSPLRLRIDGRIFRDSHNREVTLRGINCAADAKFPAHPHVPGHVREHFFEGDTCSFVDRPFPVSDADTHFARLKGFGYNTIRYIFTWEAIEHGGPGKYDEEWIQHTIQVLRKARAYGFYVFMDPHQDVWSRFTGGSGAPMWTLYAAGLNPETLQPTTAAIAQNTWPEGPENYPKMVWATNYYRLACQVMFTLFFAGRDFAPKAILDGKNIQDYLQEHFNAALRHLAQRIHEAGDLERDVVIGWESVNEPNKGVIGTPNITVIPAEQALKNDTSPTAWQAMLLGSGRPCEVETYAVGSFGPYKTGTQLVDPKGVKAWLPADYDDSRYGWERHPDWKLGECIWAQHGVWDPSKDKLLKKDYFGHLPGTKTKVDEEYFMNHYFVQYFRAMRSQIKAVFPDSIIFCQPTPFEIPPNIKGTEDDTNDLVYTPHFYDGITLMTKKWNRFWNVDVVGILRGRYLTPAFAVKVGESAIRNSFKEQLACMRQEGLDNMGNHPCIFSEIGIPYDMDDKYAYKTGDYVSQVLAMDANHFALEGSGVNGFTLWVYVALNDHKWGDQWNGEDLSIYSVEDKPLPISPFKTPLKSPTASVASLSQKPDVDPSNLQKTLSSPPMSRVPSILDGDISASGYRAAEAYVRPSPYYTSGKLTSYGFDLRNCSFRMELDCAEKPSEDAPTEVFLPEFHFPRDRVEVESSSGKWTIEIDEGGLVQRLRWWHGTGSQALTVKGVKRKLGGGEAGQEEDEEGYLEQCRQNSCQIM